MIKLHDLKPSEGSKKERKRVGRGNASGQGTTAGRGYKGQKARSGGYTKVGFEGGQMPLQRRLPKFGFKNYSRKSYTCINLDRINILPNDKDITPENLVNYGLISKVETKNIKILGNGNIEKAYTIKAHKFSKSAKEKIEKAGGKTEVIV
jgi:large subunit ribosomal protein L15